MNEREKECRYKIIDVETGVVIGDFEEGSRVISPLQLDTCRKYAKDKKEQGIEFVIKDFAKVNTKELALLIPELSANEAAVLCALIPHVEYETGCITVGRKHEFTIDELRVICVGMSRQTLSNTIKELIKHGVIATVKNDNGIQYLINPWICHKGKRINQTLANAFRHYRLRSLGGKLARDVHSSNKWD